MDDLDAPPPPTKSSLNDSTKTLIGVLVALVVVLLVAGLGIARVRDARDKVEKVVTTTTTTAAAAGGSAAPSSTTPASNLTAAQARIVEEIKGQVAAIRGLPWKGSLPVKVVSKDALAQKVRELNAEEMAKNREELIADEAVLKLLQLIGKDVDYAKAIDSILAGGVLGFYDDEVKELYVGGGSADGMDPATKVTLAHELVHALTDQHFDFGPKTKILDDQNRTEEAAAFSALIEGDAELTARLWQEQHLSARERQLASLGGSAEAIGAYARAPRYLLESLFFPYQSGVTFVESRHQAGGFAEVDKAYRNPPTSTEHILHPETYASGQTWSPPGLPDLAAATGCGAVDTGTLGEFDMIQILSRELSTGEARRAAAGWNGDAYSVVRCGSALGLADRWQTDNPADAGRLADALARWARGWSGSTRAADAEGRVSGANGSASVVRSGGRIDLILADNAETADRLARVVGAAP
jgi:Zn-dependent peptidase ImmA (M78 family)